MLETDQGNETGAHVYVSENTMKRLQADWGDVVEIVGSRTTVAACLSPRGFRQTQLEDDVIKMNAVTRSNAGVWLGDRVSIRKTSAGFAEKVTLVPVYKNTNVVRNDLIRKDSVFSSSNRIPVVVGDNIVVHGTSGQQLLQVIEIKPAQGMIINNASVSPEDPKNKVLNANQDASERAVVIFPSKTEVEVLRNESHVRLLDGNPSIARPVSDFPAFLVSIGQGSRTDYSLEKFLSLSIHISGYEGSANCTYEVKMGKVAAENPAGMMQKLMGLATGKVAPDKAEEMKGFFRMMGGMEEIQSRSGPYIAEACRIVEDANKEWRNGNTSPSPDEVKYRILKRWAEK